MSTRFHLSVSVNQGYNEVRWVKDFVWPQGLIVSLNLLQAVKNRDFFFLFFILHRYTMFIWKFTH